MTWTEAVGILSGRTFLLGSDIFMTRGMRRELDEISHEWEKCSGQSRLVGRLFSGEELRASEEVRAG